MSSYDPDTPLQLRPRNWLESFVAKYALSHEEARARNLGEATYQMNKAKEKRAELALRRSAADAGFFFLGGKLGRQDQYIEEELAARKRAQEEQ